MPTRRPSSNAGKASRTPCAAVAPRRAGGWRGFPGRCGAGQHRSTLLRGGCRWPARRPGLAARARPCGLARRRADRGGGHRCGGTFRPAASPSPVEPATIGGQSTATARGGPCRAPGAHRRRRRAVGRIAGSAGGHGDRPRAAALAKSPEHPPALGHGCGCQEQTRSPARRSWRRPEPGCGGRHPMVADPAARTSPTAPRPASPAAQPAPGRTLAGDRRCLRQHPPVRRPGPGQGVVGDAVRGGLSAARPPGRAARHRAAGAMALAGAEGFAGVAGLATPAGRRRRYAAARRPAPGRWLAGAPTAAETRRASASAGAYRRPPARLAGAAGGCLPESADRPRKRPVAPGQGRAPGRELGPSIGISAN